MPNPCEISQQHDKLTRIVLEHLREAPSAKKVEFTQRDYNKLVAKIHREAQRDTEANREMKLLKEKQRQNKKEFKLLKRQERL